MKRILITGITGFVGTSLAQFFRDKEGVKTIGHSRDIQKALSKFDGFDIDYTLGEESVIKQSMTQIINKNVDLLVGTSMGGWLATKLSNMSSIPFAAFNPVISPSETLQTYIGEHKDFYGKEYFLEEHIVNNFTKISSSGRGLIFLDEGDELIDSFVSKKTLEQYYTVTTYTGGTHRFEHIPESIKVIEKFVVQQVSCQ